MHIKTPKQLQKEMGLQIKTAKQMKGLIEARILDQYAEDIVRQQRSVLAFMAGDDGTERYDNFVREAKFPIGVANKEHGEIVEAALRKAGWNVELCKRPECVDAWLVFILPKIHRGNDDRMPMDSVWG